MPELAPFNAEHLIPRFVGVSAAAAPDAPPTMTIEDVTAGFRAPCVADIKMGTQTWQPGCSAAYRARKLAQDAQCTTAAYGFRFSGVCFPDATYGHDFGWHALADAQMLACLRAVLQCVPAPRWAAAVDAVRARVAAVRRAVAAAPWSFVASSLLVVYEGAPAAAPAAAPADPVVVLVDFEHTERTPGRVDTGFLLGCDNLLRFLQLLRDDPQGPQESQDPQESQSQSQQ